MKAPDNLWFMAFAAFWSFFFLLIRENCHLLSIFFFFFFLHTCFLSWNDINVSYCNFFIYSIIFFSRYCNFFFIYSIFFPLTINK